MGDDNWDLFAVVRSCTTSTSTPGNNASTTVKNDYELPASRNDDLGNGSDKVGIWREEEPPLACLASLKFEEDDDPFSFPNLSSVSQSETLIMNSSGCLQDSYKPFLSHATGPTTITATTNPATDPSSSTPLLLLPDGAGGGGQHHQQLQLQLQQQAINPNAGSIGISPPLTPTASTPPYAFAHSQQQLQPHFHQRSPPVLPLRNMPAQPPKSRKRKNQQKRTVSQVSADNLSSDPWAWRKYGQKPIKGSPYPRNYYRCSSSKGCSARKQLERSNVDPNVFIVTYTGDHTHPRPTHRNSLAGSTRNKLSSSSATSRSDSAPETSSPPSAATPVSPDPAAAAALLPEESIDMAPGDDSDETDHADVGDEDDDDLLIPNINMHIDEDLFKGLEELVTGRAAAAASSGSTAAAAAAASGLGRSSAFGHDNFSSWGTGSSPAAGAAAGGAGC